MLIRAYGLFWRADEIDWFPGSGNKRSYQLLGRRGWTTTLQLADFRTQEGIYILYGNYGAYYVGLAAQLGNRLRDHQKDHLRGRWDRFSWFGFSNVLKQADPETGLQVIKKLKLTVGAPKAAIADMEAMLIYAIGPSNTNKMKFRKADEWKQVTREQRETLLRAVQR